ncbi:methyltransferase domain-containing protein [Nocardia sp. BMG111209]|uniref:methyltransferase domain-containing protein n=1 Tax=Nocardia sp. BMG111209 TaxID=1160137 RepID=UPI000380D09E|nr:methyltransferase domain-containing protein [Nocardia sp. BMG111209]
MDSPTYVLNQSFPSERARLEALARLWDAGTMRLVEEIGLGPGMRCLEAGAGTGSVAAALAGIVGDEGHVLAVDRDIRFLDDLPPQVEVRCADILTDDLPPARFDLVHARLLVAHLHPHREALRRLAAAVAPGGWLLVEEVDWTYADRVEPDAPVHTAMLAALTEIMGAGGFDATYGRRLLGDTRTLGFTDVSAQYRGLQSGHETAWLAWQFLVEQFHDRMVHGGFVSRADVNDWWALTRAGTHIVTGPAVFAVRARRPLPIG